MTDDAYPTLDDIIDRNPRVPTLSGPLNSDESAPDTPQDVSDGRARLGFGPYPGMPAPSKGAAIPEGTMWHFDAVRQAVITLTDSGARTITVAQVRNALPAWAATYAPPWVDDALDAIAEGRAESVPGVTIHPNISGETRYVVSGPCVTEPDTAQPVTDLPAWLAVDQVGAALDGLARSGKSLVTPADVSDRSEGRVGDRDAGIVLFNLSGTGDLTPDGRQVRYEGGGQYGITPPEGPAGTSAEVAADAAELLRPVSARSNGPLIDAAAVEPLSTAIRGIGDSLRGLRIPAPLWGAVTPPPRRVWWRRVLSRFGVEFDPGDWTVGYIHRSDVLLFSPLPTLTVSYCRVCDDCAPARRCGR